MLGDKIRKLIKRKGIKQIDVCRAVGLSPSRLSNYLSGSREPDLETLSRVARFLEVKLDYFAYGDNIKNTKEIGENIKKMREKRGFSKGDLAAVAKLDVQLLSRLELGYGEFERDLIENLAGCLTCKVSDLIGEEEGYSMDLATSVAAESEAVLYEPEAPVIRFNLNDVEDGRCEKEKGAVWIAVNDGRFAPKVNESDILYVEKINLNELADREPVLYFDGTSLKYMRAFVSADKVLFAPEVGAGEPVIHSKDAEIPADSRVYKIHWHAVKY
ncbi:helix-turn-helix domain-containing protein [Seleniivibrio woodruffii]|uniref:Transcriptional regulator with XRE-family HTH domain n=1 Tax=Seleniivibrio woodruffii TaxID=1078050 RepID=A0A4R1K6C5_9BACT|nr:helix-turn-helix transcriptional regulator [Seleniivibrio woodruffii]TCK59313.1 transcriptional regulator with XRE-family HTH domain [Seleniivibrio woodruffii]TVZ35648.1 transcriptional regulator with XRE-family HTH domain [Seleniivibrio woodruffii]